MVSIPESHILVIGPTGSGKTNTVKVLLEEFLERNIKVLVLDWHGEYRGLRRYIPGENLEMNILELGDALKYDPEFIVDLFSQVFLLSEPQWYLLQRSLREIRPPIKLSTLISAIEEQPVKDWRDYEIKAALLRRLAILNEGVMGRVLNGDKPPYFLFEENASVDLSVLPLKYRSLLVLVLLKHLYDYSVYIRGVADRIMHVTVIEEAWNVVPYRARWEPPSIGERLFLELRKFGEQVVAVSQRIDDISERVLRNCQLILLHSPQVQDLVKLGLPREEVERMSLVSKKGIVYALYQGSIRKVRVRRAKRL